MLEKSHVAVITVHVQKLDLCRTWQSASLSFRKQQRNGLSGTVKSFNFFFLPEKESRALVFSVNSPS